MKGHYKLVLGLVAGIVLGTLVHPYQDLFWIQKINEFIMVPMGQIFLRLLFMVVVPMVFSALVLGVYDLAKHQGVGKVASKTLFYTVIASTFSVLIGIGLVNFFQPGKGFKVDTSLFQTTKTNIVSSCDCPIGTPQQNLQQNIQVYNNPLWYPEPAENGSFLVGNSVYAIENGNNFYTKATVISINNGIYKIQF